MMPQRFRPLLGLAAALPLLGGCGGASRDLVVVHTTDVHGYYAEPEAKPGETPAGGLRRLAAYVEGLRASGRPVLLLDSGDMWSGTLLSDRSEGALGVRAYAALGYDAVALGNHEFDYGPAGASREGGSDPFGALRMRIAEAPFPVLASNLVDRSTGALPAWTNLHASTVVKRGPFRIGIVGAITEDTPSITFPHVGAQLEFTDAAASVAREATKLRAEGADVVFAVVHLGGSCEDVKDPEDLSSCESDAPVFRLARALPPGLVDAIFAGHTHRLVAHRVEGIPILQPGAYGRNVGLLELRPKDGGGTDVVLHAPVPLTAAAGDSEAARAVGAVLGPEERDVEAIRAEKLGARLVRPLPRDRERSSPLGAFLCDVLLSRFPDRGICLLNSGGLRNDLPAGEITYGQLYDVLPFGNLPAEIDLGGDALLELLRIGTSGAHGVVQVAGLEVTYDLGREPCPTEDRDGDGDVDTADRQRLVKVTLADGTPLDPTKTYKVLTNSFLARGGDSWRPVLGRLHSDRIRILEDSLPILDLVAAWMREARPIVDSPERPVLPKPRVVALGQDPNVRCPR